MEPEFAYNERMLNEKTKQAKPRKKRADRSHILYLLTCLVTGEQYVGLAVKRPGPVHKTLHNRMNKHVQRALSEDKDWALCVAIRTHGRASFEGKVIKVVRGRAEAHKTERKLIMKYQPALNTA